MLAPVSGAGRRRGRQAGHGSGTTRWLCKIDWQTPPGHAGPASQTSPS